MKTILTFMDKTLKTYTIIYVIILHVIAIYIISLEVIDYNKSIADVILEYILIIIIFALCDLCFFIPSLFIIACGTILSIMMLISVPVFLFFSLFEILGATVDILKFGFIKTLVICILSTPIGLMNLKSLSIITDV